MNFDKIAGYEIEKQQLSQLRDLLLNLKDYSKSGIRIPRGVLLYGPPGVGKTVMSKSVAGNGIELIELRSADCTKDTSAENVQAAFEKARASVPCVLLIDELDKIAEGSPNYYMEGNDRIMKVLLQELDAQTENSGILVLATCNYFEFINPALLRSGRFDRIIGIENPSLENRAAISEMYLSKINIKKSVDVEYLAKVTNGYTGAQIECIINEAGILAMETKSMEITMPLIRTAMNRIAFKSIEGKAGKEDERRISAVHEAGHAIAAMTVSADTFSSATIIPQGQTKGHIHMFGIVKNYGLTGSVADAENEVMIALAGTAAEKLVFGTKYLTSENDLDKANNILQHMITRIGGYGYDMVFNIQQQPIGPFIPEYVKEKIFRTKTEILNRLDGQATEIITSNRRWFDAVVNALVDRFTLTKEEILELKDT